MAPAQEVSDHYDLSRLYLATALDSLTKGRLEPALFNAYHALELACKAAILAETGETGRTHHAGGVFGRLFRKRVGGEDCPELEIEGHLGVVVLDLGDARLAGAHPLRQVLLREGT